MQIRNPRFTDDGRIDCEIYREDRGWCPYTANYHDPHGSDIYIAALDLEPEPYVPVAPSVPDLLAYAADLRWQRETGGVMVGGVSVATDDRSKTLLQGARTAADADPAHVEGWKTAGGWIDLDAPTIIAISDAVRAHVSETFAVERSVSAQIDAGEITTYAAIDAAFDAIARDWDA